MDTQRPDPSAAASRHQGASGHSGSFGQIFQGVTSHRDLAPGVSLGRYLLRDRIGPGEFGEEWIGVDSETDGEMRIIVPSARVGNDRGVYRRLMREVRHADALASASIHRVQWHGVADGIRIVTCDDPNGESVEDFANRTGRLPIASVIDIAHQVASLLVRAESVGVVHRWLRPSLMHLAQDGRVRISGFGLWPLGDWIGEVGRDAAPGAASWGYRISYSAPEALSGGDVTGKSDVYSLGVSILRLATGRTPESGNLRSEILKEFAIRHIAPDTPALDGIQEELQRTVARMCEQDPAKRLTPSHALAELTELANLIEDAGRIPKRRAPRPAKSLDAQGRLALYPTTIFGRDAQAAAIASALLNSQVVTILGTGGVGKTTLAASVGENIRHTLPGGVWFCDLSSCRERSDIPVAVARGMRVELRVGNTEKQVLDAMAGREEALYILDNCEQTHQSVGAVVSEWSKHCPKARFLITSRETIRAVGEVIHALPPLEVPSSDVASSAPVRSKRIAGTYDPIPESVTASPAVQLFLDRAATARPGFELVPTNWGAVVGIVRKLDGIPLAIRLAAAHVSSLSPHQILERLEGCTTSLAGDGELAGHRHASLQAAMDWSWGLLEPWEQAAYGQLAVFQGGFTLDAAEAVVDVSGWPNAPWVIDIVHNLWAKSLLTCTFDAQGGLRFGMLSTIHEHALDSLRARIPAFDAKAFVAGGPTESAARQRHWEYFGVHGHPSVIVNTPLSKLRTGHAEDTDNVVSAFRHASEAQSMPWASWLACAALDILKGTNRLVEAAELIPLAESVPIDSDESEVWRKWAIGDVVGSSRGPKEMLALISPSMETAKRCKDTRYLALAHYATIWGYMYLGNLPKVIEHAKAGLEVLRRTADHKPMRLILSLAEVAYHRFSGNYDEAFALLGEIEKDLPEGEEVAYGAMICNDYSLLHLYKGNFRKALEMSKKAVMVGELFTLRRVDAQYQIGIIHRVLGETKEAIEVLRENHIHYRGQGSLLRANVIKGQLHTALFQHAGFSPEGEQHLLDGIVTDEPISPYFQDGGPLLALACWSALTRGDVKLAAQRLEQAVASEKKVGHANAMVRMAAAAFNLKCGNLSEALAAADQGLKEAGGDPDDSWPINSIRHRIRLEAARLGELGLTLEAEHAACIEHLKQFDALVEREQLQPRSIIAIAAEQLREALLNDEFA